MTGSEALETLIGMRIDAVCVCVSGAIKHDGRIAMSKHSAGKRKRLGGKTDREVLLNWSSTDSFLNGILMYGETGRRIAWIGKV